MVRRAENGTVSLAHLPPDNMQSPTLVQRGDIVWTETIRPVRAARLLSDSAERIRPNRGQVVASGTLLFGIELSTGTAFCPQIEYQAAVSRSQCFRDFDDDGDFDGGYLSRSRGLDSQYITAFLHGLAPISPLKYEHIEPDESFNAQARFVFADIRRGYPRFRFFIEGERMADLESCEPVEGRADECIVMGVHLRFEEVEDSYQFTLISSPPIRYSGISVSNTGLTR